MNLTEFIEKTELELFLYLPKRYQNQMEYPIKITSSGQMFFTDEINKKSIPEVYLDLSKVYEEYIKTGNFSNAIKNPLSEYLEAYEIYAAKMKDRKQQLEAVSEYPARKVIFSMLPAEQRENLNSPCREFGDMVMVYHLVMGNDEGILKTSLIHYDLMKIWQVTEEILYQSAIKNTPYIFPPKITSLDIYGCKAAMVGNEKNTFGISALLYKKEQNPLHMLAEEFQSDLEILAFSMHEVFVTDGSISCREVLNLLYEKNNVNHEKICFSEAIYYYDREFSRLITNEYERALLKAEKTHTTLDPGMKSLLESKMHVTK